MSLTNTLLALCLAAAVLVLANIRSRRPLPLGEVRLVPYGALQFVALVMVLVFAAHLVSLVTGHPLKPRRFS